MIVPCARCSRDATHIAVRQIVPLCADHLAEAGHHHVAITGCDRDLWRYTLTVVEETAAVQAYRLTSPEGGEMQSIRLAFLPSGYIVVYGDLCPGRVTHDNLGIVSVGGYNRAWFVGATSEHYLCSKFTLGSVFHPDAAAAHLREHADDTVGEERASTLRDLADDAERVDPRDDGEVAEWVGRFYGAECGEIDPCFGFDRPNAALLCAIQRRFRALWLAREATTAQPEAPTP